MQLIGLDDVNLELKLERRESLLQHIYNHEDIAILLIGHI